MAVNGNGLPELFERMDREFLSIVGADSPEDATAEQRFTASLLQLDVLHDATAGRSDRGAMERYTYALFLKASIDLINSNPDLYEHKLAAVPVRMLAALEDLDRGKVAPSLRPRKRSRHDTGPRSRHQSVLHGHLAGIVEGLITRGHMSEPDAAHWVQRRLSAAGIKHLTGDQLLEWRKQCRGRNKDSFMLNAYYRTQITDWSDHLARAEKLIAGYLKLE